jgi:hypothetical protein
MRKVILLISVLVFAIGCDSDDGKKSARVRVNHYQQPVIGFGPAMLTYVVQEDEAIGSDDWDFLYQSIQGFNYELGYTYDLRVIKKENDPDLQDAPRYEYILKELISKQKVADNTPFEVRLSIYYSGTDDIESFVTGDADAGFKLLERTPVVCGDLCASLSEKLEEEKMLYGTFVHDGVGIELKSLRQEQE